MNIIFNELSLDIEIKNHLEFHEKIKQLMCSRRYLLNNNFYLLCHRNVINTTFSNGKTIFNYINNFDRDEKLDILNWLSSSGPFWDDNQLHDTSDHYFFNDKDVSGSALAEAAAFEYCNIPQSLFSLESNEFSGSPLHIQWKTNIDEFDIGIQNFSTLDDVKHNIKELAVTTDSWESLEAYVKKSFCNITFIDGCFLPLEKTPFYRAAAKSIIEKLKILNKLKCCFDGTGGFTAEGSEIYQNHFVGDKAWFTDSTDAEKREFEHEMTFKFSDQENIFCPWHGKIKTPQIRIHFTFPITSQSPLYVAYIGDKITKR